MRPFVFIAALSMLWSCRAEQRQAIEAAHGSHVFVVDRVKMEKYALVRSDFFQDVVMLLHEHGVDVAF